MRDINELQIQKHMASQVLALPVHNIYCMISIHVQPSFPLPGGKTCVNN